MQLLTGTHGLAGSFSKYYNYNGSIVAIGDNFMKLLLLLVCLFGFSGCTGGACDGTKTEAYAKFADVHKDVFGCWPKDYTPPVEERSLEAEGPKVETDFLGNECGKPVYTSPCAGCK